VDVVINLPSDNNFLYFTLKPVSLFFLIQDLMEAQGWRRKMGVLDAIIATKKSKNKTAY
jgi:hypothetical protein